MPTPQDIPLLSLLIPGIPARMGKAAALVQRLESQGGARGEVEILLLVDNRTRSIAQKRNDLLALAHGRHLAFLDDDDGVSNDYVPAILGALRKDPQADVVCFDQLCVIDGEPATVSFGLGNPHQRARRQADGRLAPILRPPYHMCAWRSALAKSEPFREVFSPLGQSCEDIDWLARLYPQAQTSVRIDKVLHHYLYNSRTTASRNAGDPAAAREKEH